MTWVDPRVRGAQLEEIARLSQTTGSYGSRYSLRILTHFQHFTIFFVFPGQEWWSLSGCFEQLLQRRDSLARHSLLPQETIRLWGQWRLDTIHGTNKSRYLLSSSIIFDYEVCQLITSLQVWRCNGPIIQEDWKKPENKQSRRQESSWKHFI